MTSRLTVVALAVALVPVGLGPQLAAARTDTQTTEANITRLTTRILESSQFSHHAFDAARADAFLDRYLDSLDPSRSLLLQSDVDELARFRPTLVEATRDAGDTSASRVIFARFLHRLSEQTAYLDELLRKGSFDFTGHDVYSFDRDHASRPKDIEAAHTLWREQLRSEYLQAKLAGTPPAQIVRTLSLRHERQLATMKAVKSDEVVELYLNALAHVYDPHSDYLGHEEMESFAIQMSLSLFGIGATLENVDGTCRIRELVPGGPAARSGLVKPGDRIVAVAQEGKEPVDITNMPLSRAVELIRGPEGSTVTLSILSAGAAEGSPSKLAAIVRRQVKLEDHEAKARIVDVPSGAGRTLRLGVVTVPSFYASTGGGDPRSATADVARLLKKLEQERVRGIVLDLRDDPGGSLQEAISLSGLFIRTGPIVQTRDEAGRMEVGADRDPSVQYDGPLIVLTSKFSASASEILAGALQDYGRALVVGDSTTFGKGTVQTVLPLAQVMDRARLQHTYDPGALKVTISKFYRPSGASTQLRGVASDIVLPSTSDVSGVSESALKDALPWDRVPSTDYDELDRVAPYVGALRERSAERVGRDKRFIEVKEDMARLSKVVAEKAISLNEEERQRDLTQAKTRDKTREEEERAALASQPPTYEINLANASAAGLPPRIVFQASKGGSSTPGEEDARTKRPPAGDDVTLDETLRILADYVGLLSS